MKLIDVLRKKYNGTLFSIYNEPDMWQYVIYIYSDYVDVVEYRENDIMVDKTITWIDFFQYACPEENIQIIDKLMPEITQYIVNKTKENLI